MMFAGHFPTKHFSLAEWQAMPVWVPKYEGDFPPEGFSRSSLRGKPIVRFFSWGERQFTSYAVRPIVRVPMGRRVMRRFSFIKRFRSDVPSSWASA